MRRHGERCPPMPRRLGLQHGELPLFALSSPIIGMADGIEDQR